VVAACTKRAGECAVHVEHLLASSPFKKIVNVLGNQRHGRVILRLQTRQSLMGGIVRRGDLPTVRPRREMYAARFQPKAPRLKG